MDEFRQFVAGHAAALLRSAYLLTGDRQLAEDLVQDALARTHMAWHRLKDVGNASAYARKVMYHLQVSWWRRRRVAETLTDTAPVIAAPGRDTALELSVRAALLKLTAGQRAVIVLRFFEDLTEAETAKALGVSKSTVHFKSEAAFRRLARLVPELEGERG
ncbi:RNA polymerase sigma-70 factor (sigma-E family) [Stackebrandtia albiflava]|uniref:RNA polymerase sigma-70 factor (Sigma-E family) n=1 Tax=Stackebrandtia albiflava TaxID=406432 RepID=A0A562VB37_9ACTN|nr:SigE family RNA polymerase sigma factor [Stackebrandtia albiflava]TWJ15100.1 RNA polymerase sigma-70 factor (sigma-E family) [Stackebrandtia albiflava]